MRKLIRDCNCRPVIRGILESLLHYLTQELSELTGRRQEKPKSDIAAERVIDWRGQTSTGETRFTIPRLSKVYKTTQGKTVEISSKTADKYWSGPRSKYGDHIAKDLMPRRLTTFQLLQSKFLRATPKPPITHQREVGTLSPSRKRTGDVNRCQDAEHKIHRREKTRKEHELKRGKSVKDIVATFALAEQKEEGRKILKPIKARLLGRGNFLSSLMDRFETIANVNKGSNAKHSSEKPPDGVEVVSNIKKRQSFYEKQERRGMDQAAHKNNQHKQTKNRLFRQHLKKDQGRSGKEQLSGEALDVCTEVKSNLEERNNLKSEQTMQTGDEKSERKAEGQCSLKNINIQAYDKEAKGCRSDERGETQKTVEVTGVTNRLNYGQLEQLCLTSISESSQPELSRLLPQVEAKVHWHVATITSCSPVCSTCVDSLPKQDSVEPSEQPQPNLKAGVFHTATRWCHRKSIMAESATKKADGRCTIMHRTEEHITNTGFNSMVDRTPGLDSTKDKPIQKGTPKYVIPRVHRFEDQHGIEELIDSSSQLVSHPEIKNPLVARPLTHPDGCNSGVVRCHPKGETVQVLQATANEKTAASPQKNIRETKEEETPVKTKDPHMSPSVRQSEGTSNNTVFEESDLSAAKIQLQRENPKHKPKYTTINYGDPSVKQTYKPKIIRFTDTFTF